MGNGLAQNGSRHHDAGGEQETDFVDAPDPSVLPGSVIVPDERPHSLDNAVGRQVEEGLQLIVGSQDKHVCLGEAGQNHVQRGGQQGRQSQAEDGGDTDGVEPRRHVLPQ